MKEEKTVQTRIEADVEAQMKTSDTNKAAQREVFRSGCEVRTEGSEERQEE